MNCAKLFETRVKKKHKKKLEPEKKEELRGKKNEQCRRTVKCISALKCR